MRLAARCGVLFVVSCAATVAEGRVHVLSQPTVLVTFVGRVTVAGTNAPLSHARVRLVAIDSSATVDESGEFQLTARIVPGQYELRAQRIGYASASHRIAVRDSGVTAVPVFMLKEASVRPDDLIVPNCTKVRRRPARLPAGAWILTERDSTGREVLTLCRVPRR